MSCARGVKRDPVFGGFGRETTQGSLTSWKVPFPGGTLLDPRDYMGGLTCGPPCSCPGVSFYLEKHRFDVRARVVVVHATPGVCPCSPRTTYFHGLVEKVCGDPAGTGSV